MGIGNFLTRLRAVALEPMERRVELLEESLSAWERGLRLDLERESRRYDDPRCLVRHGYRCLSQNDEDGLIDEALRRIGTSSRFFVEFGCGTGLENNTLSLLLQGWRGLWIEADPGNCARVRAEFREPLESGQLALIEERVTVENLEGLLVRGGVPAEPDVLSIDVDGNDFWLWKALVRYRPRLTVIEYNASLGRSARVVRPYDPARRWDEDTAFGASLGALEDLGREKGDVLVGCCLAGVNAIFVRSDLAGDRFLEPFTAEVHYQPPRFGRHGGGHRPRWGRFVSP